MSTITLYGIKNCDSVKKSRKWLDKNSVEYTYHDFRLDGVEKSLIEEFLKNIEVGLLINKRSTSWKKLPDKEKTIGTKLELVGLLLKNPTNKKRPIIKTKKINLI